MRRLVVRSKIRPAIVKIKRSILDEVKGKFPRGQKPGFS
jgi:hypothetical protein